MQSAYKMFLIKIIFCHIAVTSFILHINVPFPLRSFKYLQGNHIETFFGNRYLSNVLRMKCESDDGNHVHMPDREVFRNFFKAMDKHAKKKISIDSFLNHDDVKLLVDYGSVSMNTIRKLWTRKSYSDGILNEEDSYVVLCEVLSASNDEPVSYLEREFKYLLRIEPTSEFDMEKHSTPKISFRTLLKWDELVQLVQDDLIRENDVEKLWNNIIGSFTLQMQYDQFLQFNRELSDLFENYSIEKDTELSSLSDKISTPLLKKTSMTSSIPFVSSNTWSSTIKNSDDNILSKNIPEVVIPDVSKSQDLSGTAKTTKKPKKEKGNKDTAATSSTTKRTSKEKVPKDSSNSSTSITKNSKKKSSTGTGKTGGIMLDSNMKELSSSNSTKPSSLSSSTTNNTTSINKPILQENIIIKDTIAAADPSIFTTIFPELNFSTSSLDKDSGHNTVYDMHDVDVWASDYDPRTAFDTPFLNYLEDFFFRNADKAADDPQINPKSYDSSIGQLSSDGYLLSFQKFSKWKDLLDILEEGQVDKAVLKDLWLEAMQECKICQDTGKINYDTFLRLNVRLDLVLFDVHNVLNDLVDEDFETYHRNEFDKISNGKELITFEQLLQWNDLKGMLEDNIVNIEQVKSLWMKLPREIIRTYLAPNKIDQDLIIQGEGINLNSFLALSTSLLDLHPGLD